MAGFATKTAYDYEREYSLDEWASNTGQGLMGLCYQEPPEECLRFCISQFERFRVPLYEGVDEVISIGAQTSLFFLDMYSPYALLDGISDVNISDDWAKVTYQIFDTRNHNRTSYEPEPQYVESFVYAPGQSEAFFNEFMGKPGLKALPGFMGEQVIELLEGEWNGEPCEELLTPIGKDRLHAVCRGDQKVMRAYFELAAWSSFMWLAGPVSRDFRLYNHDIMSTAILDGECILVDGMIISPKYYNKLDRPPKSCNKCGVQVWCVEPTLVMSHSAFICEKCLNFDLPSSKFTNCGAKFCTFSACPNHPYHHLGHQGAMRSYKERGQLMTMARGETVPQVMGQQPSLKRLGI